jgi:hypothetical protein
VCEIRVRIACWLLFVVFVDLSTAGISAWYDIHCCGIRTICNGSMASSSLRRETVQVSGNIVVDFFLYPGRMKTRSLALSLSP